MNKIITKTNNMKNINLTTFKSLLSNREINYKEQKEGNVTLIIPEENLKYKAFDNEGNEL